MRNNISKEAIWTPAPNYLSNLPCDLQHEVWNFFIFQLRKRMMLSKIKDIATCEMVQGYSFLGKWYMLLHDFDDLPSHFYDLRYNALKVFAE